MSAAGFIAHLFQWVVFIAAAAVCLLGALMMVTRRNPIHSALWLIVTFFSLAVIYVTLKAQFIAVAQVVVYAGAIMMLIIFVIMLIHLEQRIRPEKKAVRDKGHRSFHHRHTLSRGCRGGALLRRQAGSSGLRNALDGQRGRGGELPVRQISLPF